MQKLFVQDIMTENPISVGPDDLVVYAAKTLVEHGFNGLPVVGPSDELLGVLTEYDLILKGDDLHLPTLIKIFGNLDFYKKDKSLVEDNLKKMLSVKVKDVMNPEPLTVKMGTTIETLAELFANNHRVNPIPVINSIGKLVGIVSRFDIVKFFADRSAVSEAETGDQIQIANERVEQFMGDFEKKFVLVSKTRARFWPIVSALFLIVGFIIAFALILRITVRY